MDARQHPTREQLAGWSEADESAIRGATSGIMEAINDCDETTDDDGFCSCARFILFTLRDSIVHERLHALATKGIHVDTEEEK